MGRWMPESRHLTEVFLGEFFWSPAYQSHLTPYHGYEDWTRGDQDQIPKEVLVTTERYFWENSGYDCSIDDTIEVYIPCKWLADLLGLQWNGVEGQFVDNKGNLIAFDPSVMTPGPGALLISRDFLLRALSEAGYDILWTFLGEKNIIGGRMMPDEWKGRLEISGAFRIQAGKLEGSVHSKFVSREKESRAISD